MRRSMSLALLLLASACTVGPNYKQPDPPAPAAFAEPQPTDGGVDLAQWWRAFDDPELTRLIAIGLQQAPDLQTAESRVREARYAVIQARSAGLPSVSGSGNAEYIRLQQLGQSSGIQKLANRIGIDQSGGNGGAGGVTGSGTTFDQNAIPHNLHTFSAGFDASWELDLFGGVRRSVEAARAQEQAAEWNARDARVQLAAEIASDYLQMRGYQEQARIAAAEADRRARSLSILRHTAEVGLLPQGNAIRQQTQLAQAQAQIAPLKAQAGVQIHAIGVLVGEQPEALITELNTDTPLPKVPPQVPPGLPVDLIRRRPDVRAAERQIAAATAQIGVAVADLYPRITLTAMPQLATAWLGGFFLGKTFNLTAAGSASFPIFDFGQRRAVINERKEEREQAYIQWRQTVLGALRDVEDALVRVAGERDSNADLRGGVIAAQRSLKTSEALYRVGLQDYTPVLNDQEQLLQAQNSLAQSDVMLRTDLASLYKALGGGWSEGDAPSVRPVIEDAPKTR